MATTAASAGTATRETVLKAESSERNQSQPRSPKINNRAARAPADQARDARRGGAVPLVVMLHLGPVMADIRSHASGARARKVAACVISATIAFVRQSAA